MRTCGRAYGRAIGISLVSLLVSGISEAAGHQAWLKQSIDVPVFIPRNGGRIAFGAEQEEKFGKHGFIDPETLLMIKLRACPYFALGVGDRFAYARSRG